MPKKSDINIHINDGEAMLYRRERSSNWYLSLLFNFWLRNEHFSDEIFVAFPGV